MIDDVTFARVLRNTLGGGFYLADEFQEGLGEARAAAMKAQRKYESARESIEERVARAIKRERLESDEFIVMRDNLAELPRGIRVLREAPTYYLCEMELDEAARRLLAEREAAMARVAELEAAARERLGRELAGLHEDIAKKAEKPGA